MRRYRVVGPVLALVVAIALAIEGWYFGRHVAMFHGMPILLDARLYFAMGRGWLNGLVFYRDLFETKPPLVFLLAALSLKLTGSNAIYNLLEILFLGLLGPVLGLFSFHAARGSQRRWILTVVSLLLGLTVAGYTLHWTETFQAEGFALLFAVLPSLLIGRSLRWDIVAGVSLGMATMLKEPFGVAGTLAMLVFCTDRRVLRVLAVAAATCLVILIYSHAVGPYFQIYLPEMLTGRGTSSSSYTDYESRLRYLVPNSLGFRSLNMYRLFTHLGTPLPNLIQGVFFAVCCCLWVEHTRPRLILYCLALLGTALLSAHMFALTEQLVTLAHLMGKYVPWGDPIIVRLVSLMVIPPGLLGCVACKLHAPWSLYRRFLLLLAGLFLVSALVDYGGGDYDHRYLIFALPFLLAISLSTLIDLKTPYLTAIGGLLVLNSLMPGRYDDDALARSLQPAIQASLEGERTAKKVDALLSSCAFSQYVAVEDLLDIPAYTVNSPYQISYGISRAVGNLGVTAASQTSNVYLTDKLVVDLQRTPVIILSANKNASAIPAPIAVELGAYFTATPPPCAAAQLPIVGIQVFFRRS